MAGALSLFLLFRTASLSIPAHCHSPHPFPPHVSASEYDRDPARLPPAPHRYDTSNSLTTVPRGHRAASHIVPRLLNDAARSFLPPDSLPMVFTARHEITSRDQIRQSLVLHRPRPPWYELAIEVRNSALSSRDVLIAILKQTTEPANTVKLEMERMVSDGDTRLLTQNAMNLSSQRIVDAVFLETMDDVTASFSSLSIKYSPSNPRSSIPTIESDMDQIIASLSLLTLEDVGLEPIP